MAYLPGAGRVDRVYSTILTDAKKQQDAGYEAMTLHVGSGLEDDDAIDAFLGILLPLQTH